MNKNKNPLIQKIKDFQFIVLILVIILTVYYSSSFLEVVFLSAMGFLLLVTLVELWDLFKGFRK